MLNCNDGSATSDRSWSGHGFQKGEGDGGGSPPFFVKRKGVLF
jgi:hypothetical protein